MEITSAVRDRRTLFCHSPQRFTARDSSRLCVPLECSRIRRAAGTRARCTVRAFTCLAPAADPQDEHAVNMPNELRGPWSVVVEHIDGKGLAEKEGLFLCRLPFKEQRRWSVRALTVSGGLALVAPRTRTRYAGERFEPLKARASPERSGRMF